MEANMLTGVLRGVHTKEGGAVRLVSVSVWMSSLVSLSYVTRISAR